jgi:hypothetical protein
MSLRKCLLPARHAIQPGWLRIFEHRYKDYSSAAQLSSLSEAKLLSAGIDDKTDRKNIISALRKAGYIASPKSPRPAPVASGSNTNGLSAVQAVVHPCTGLAYFSVRWPQLSDLDHAHAEEKTYPGNGKGCQRVSPHSSSRRGWNIRQYWIQRDPGRNSWSSSYFEYPFMTLFKVLKHKATEINRAPLLTAWSTIVAERLGFRREEALSIGGISFS